MKGSKPLFITDILSVHAREQPIRWLQRTTFLFFAKAFPLDFTHFLIWLRGSINLLREYERKCARKVMAWKGFSSPYHDDSLNMSSPWHCTTTISWEITLFFHRACAYTRTWGEHPRLIPRIRRVFSNPCDCDGDGRLFLQTSVCGTESKF